MKKGNLESSKDSIHLFYLGELWGMVSTCMAFFRFPDLKT
jgi:hypothetical protein